MARSPAEVVPSRRPASPASRMEPETAFLGPEDRPHNCMARRFVYIVPSRTPLIWSCHRGVNHWCQFRSWYPRLPPFALVHCDRAGITRWLPIQTTAPLGRMACQGPASLLRSFAVTVFLQTQLRTKTGGPPGTRFRRGQRSVVQGSSGGGADEPLAGDGATRHPQGASNPGTPD